MVFTADVAEKSEDIDTIFHYCHIDPHHEAQVCIIKPAVEMSRFKLKGKYSTEKFQNFVVDFLKEKLTPLRTVQEIYDNFEGGIEVDLIQGELQH